MKFKKWAKQECLLCYFKKSNTNFNFIVIISNLNSQIYTISQTTYIYISYPFHSHYYVFDELLYELKL